MRPCALRLLVPAVYDLGHILDRLIHKMGLEEIYLAEFGRCRDEIDSQTELSERVILAEITLLGAGAVLIEKGYFDSLLGLAPLSSFLWIFWTGHTQAVSKLGGYIACELAPRLRRIAGERVLAWEEYSRITHIGGPNVYHIPYLKTESQRSRKHWLSWINFKIGSIFHRSISMFISFWFGAVTPVLLLIYGIIAIEQRHKAPLIVRHWSDFGSDARIFAIILSIFVWIAASMRFLSAKKSWELVSDVVLEKATLGENTLRGIPRGRD